MIHHCKTVLAAQLRAALLPLLLLLLTSPVQATVRPAQQWLRPLQTQLHAAETTFDLSGAVLVAQGDRVLLRRAYGLADRSFAVANRPDTRFNLASMNKMFTALAILRLVQAHQLSLDEPIRRWLPDYPNAEVASRVTVRQLLGHTSGMGNFWEALASRPTQSLCSSADFAALFAADPLLHEPGTTFEYSNAGYIVLGLLLEAVTGESYQAHLQRTVFQPLGMHDTGALPLDVVVPGRAIGYTRSQEQPGQWQSNSYVNVFCGTAAGGGYSTVDDLYRFGRALADGSLLSPELMALYSTGVVPYAKGRYALGLSEQTIGGQRVIGHSGGHIGIAGELLVLPQTGHVAVILTNGDVDAFWNVRNTITRLLLGDDPGSEAYWRTLDVIARTERDGRKAGRALAGELGGGPSLRESVIDVTAGKWLHRGDARRALALFQLNTELFPDSTDAQLRLADGARVLRDDALALAAYQRYLAVVTNDNQAAAHRDALRKAQQARGEHRRPRSGGH